MKLHHKTAQASHYNEEAENYDKFNEENSKIINQTIENILRKYHVKTVLDLTCGTGSQVFWLTKQGFQVIGSDINTKMLKIAQDKATKDNLNIKFIKRDMRTIKIGQFDAAITIFNAIGHLTKSDFEKAIQNINSNLKIGGLYIFDIFNLDYLLYGDNIVKLTIDWQINTDDIKTRKIQYSTINNDGILASYTILHVQNDTERPKISKSTLQIYTADQIKSMLERNNFTILEQIAIDGSNFDKDTTDRILTVAKKMGDIIV